MAKVRFEKADQYTVQLWKDYKLVCYVYAGHKRVGTIEQSSKPWSLDTADRETLFRFVPDYDLISQCEDKWELVRTGKNITECKARVRELFA